MSIFYVYEHWRLDRDECFYVGKGRGRRAYDMKHNRNRMHRFVVDKMSREGFAVEVRIVQSGLPQKDAFKLEIERIAFWRSQGVDLCNILPGGLGGPTWTGRKHSEEAKKKISISAIGNIGRKGQSLTLEHRKKLSEVQIGNKKSFGYKHTDEEKAQRSEKMKGNKLSLGRKQSKDEREKKSEFKKIWWTENKEKAKERMRQWWAERKARDGIC